MPSPTGRPTALYADAIRTLAHESIHLSGSSVGDGAAGDPLGEAKANCHGMQWMPYVAEQLGASRRRRAGDHALLLGRDLSRVQDLDLQPVLVGRLPARRRARHRPARARPPGRSRPGACRARTRRAAGRPGTATARPSSRRACARPPRTRARPPAGRPRARAASSPSATTRTADNPCSCRFPPPSPSMRGRRRSPLRRVRRQRDADLGAGAVDGRDLELAVQLLHALDDRLEGAPAALRLGVVDHRRDDAALLGALRARRRCGSAGRGGPTARSARGRSCRARPRRSCRARSAPSTSRRTSRLGLRARLVGELAQRRREAVVAQHDRLEREREVAQLADRLALALERRADDLARLVEAAVRDRVERAVDHQRDPGELLHRPVVEEQGEAPALVLLGRDQPVEPFAARSRGR